MSKLTEKERAGFEKIISQDLEAINIILMNQIKDFWAIARKEVQIRKGYDKLIAEKEQLMAQQKKITRRIHEIEGEMKKEDLRPEQVVELGGSMGEYGRFRGANLYGIPVESQFDYQIVEYIRANIDLDIPAKFLYDLGRACLRELTMSGTFEEARASYEKFYKLDFRKYGVDIPPRLEEIQHEKSRMITTKEMLQLENKDNQVELPGKEQTIEKNEYKVEGDMDDILD